MKQSTIKDVAQGAGVSTTTVSHVVNGTRFVEEPTRQRVLEAIARLDYHPSLAARSLITNSTKTVGVLVSNAANNFFGEILLGLEGVLRPAGYGLMLCNTDETPALEEQALKLLLSQRVDGLIIAGVSQHWDALSRASASQLPMVFADRLFPAIPGPFVAMDSEQGGYLGTSHLIEAGHRRIAILAGSTQVSASHDRVAGLRRALAEHDIPLPPEWVVFFRAEIEPAREATRRLLTAEPRPTALFVNNNVMVLGVLLEIRALGLRCPEDVSVIGFDDNPWWDVTDPPVTAVRQLSYRMGHTAAEMLFVLMSGKELAESRVIIPCELVRRRSVAPPAEDTPLPARSSSG
jgi:LacI family transcriptional regulator